jgi:hypothetical protein
LTEVVLLEIWWTTQTLRPRITQDLAMTVLIRYLIRVRISQDEIPWTTLWITLRRNVLIVLREVKQDGCKKLGEIFEMLDEEGRSTSTLPLFASSKRNFIDLYELLSFYHGVLIPDTVP